MAFAADTIVIWDPAAGSNNNGGGFSAALGGVRITSPVAFSDWVIDAADNTKATSAGRPFSANDRGNIAQVASGTGWTVQAVQIVSVAAGVATFDKALGTVGSTGGTGVLGGYKAVFTDAFLELTVAGMTHHVWATGTMTLTEAIGIAADGTAAAPCWIIGRATDGSANPTGDNRPLIDCGAYQFLGSTPNYWVFQDLRLTGTSTSALLTTSNCRIERCKATNTSTTTGREAFTVGSSVFIGDCEAQATYGQGIVTANTCILERNYVHDCATGAGVREGMNIGFGCSLLENVVDTCTVFLNMAANYANSLNRNTLYNGTTGIVGTTAYNCAFVNNILHTLTTGASWDTNEPINVWLYNDFYACDTDRTNVTAGTGDFDADPLFTDAPNGDFSRTETTADGIGITLGVG